MGAFALFFFSCTSENSDVIDKHPQKQFAVKSLSTKDLALAKQLYIDMKVSQEYNDFKAALNEFRTKLAVHNVTFPDKAQWIDWINVNLHLTNFTTVAEFEIMYDETFNKFVNVADAHPTVFSLIKNADRSELEQILLPDRGVIDYPQQTSSCDDNCYSICDGQLDDMMDTFVLMVMDAEETDSGFIEAFYNAIDAREDAYNCAILELNNCLSGC